MNRTSGDEAQGCLLTEMWRAGQRQKTEATQHSGHSQSYPTKRAPRFEYALGIGRPPLHMNLDRLLLFAAALLFSTGGAAIKACSLTSWQIASFRSGIAALTLFFFFPRTRH